MMALVADHAPLASLDWLRSHGLIIAIIIGAAILLAWLARQAVRRMQRRMEFAESLTAELDLQRAATLTQAMHYAIRVVVWTLAVLLILDQVGVNLAPLIAGAGIAGIALGFGAQSIVRDFLSGFFILLENQFAVGDIVAVNADENVSGKVEQISLRVTHLRAFDGTLHIIPNGNITMIGNKTKGWARAIVDIGVGYRESVDRVREVLEELFGELHDEPDLQRRIYDGPKVLGVENLGEYEVVVRVVADVRPPYQWEIARELRRRIKQRLDERGIEIPFPYRVMISKNDEPEQDAPRSRSKRSE